MRFLLDECTGPAVARWLRGFGHDVFSVYEDARGLPDEEVLQRANTEDRILITNDKDFGEMVFREGKEHRGVILLRLEDERVSNKIDVLDGLLQSHGDRISANFVVVKEHTVRIFHPDKG